MVSDFGHAEMSYVSMYTTEQELSSEYSPGIIKPLIYYNRPLVTGLLLSLLLLCTVFTVMYIYCVRFVGGAWKQGLASAKNIHGLIDTVNNMKEWVIHKIIHDYRDGNNILARLLPQLGPLPLRARGPSSLSHRLWL